jgi:hypothetical protein
MFDKENASYKEFVHKAHAAGMTAKLLKHYADTDKKARMDEGLCKHCAYIGTRIGGAAITARKCGNCGAEMVFDSTCTDRLCQKCATEIGHCKHCGQKLD